MHDIFSLINLREKKQRSIERDREKGGGREGIERGERERESV